MAGDREYLTEEEARRLWQRAAQLQAEAASRAEALAAWRPGGAESPPSADEAGEPPEGYALTHVRAAALEAGIEREFVDAAEADLWAERVTDAPGGKERSLSGKILGGPKASIIVRRTLRAPPRQVLDAMERVLPNEPFNLALLDRQGDPLRGGVLTFDIQGAGMWASGQHGFLGDASYADLRQVCATLTPRSQGTATELTVRGPVSGAWGWNAVAASMFTLIGGGIGVGAALGLSALVLPGLGPVAVAAMVAGGGAAARGGLAGYRALYRHGQGRGRRALVALASAVAARAEGGWAGPTAPPEPPTPPKPPA